MSDVQVPALAGASDAAQTQPRGAHPARSRERLKSAARGLALFIIAPCLLSFAIRSRLLGRDRALMGTTQALALIPGIIGQYLRTAFLRCALNYCAPNVVVEFGTIFSQSGARLGNNVYIGPMCHIGLAHVDDDVLVAAGVHIPSGPNTHGTASVSIPIRLQEGTRRPVHIGRASWIGSAAVVLADVGHNTVIAAGSIVTKPIPHEVVAAGVPARVIKARL